jgi:hypothetical protein
MTKFIHEGIHSARIVVLLFMVLGPRGVVSGAGPALSTSLADDVTTYSGGMVHDLRGYGVPLSTFRPVP